MKCVIAVRCTNNTLRVQTLHHILVLCWLYKLFFELVELAEIFVSAHTMVLIDVEFIELARRIRTNHMVRLHLLLWVMILLLVMLRLGVDGSRDDVR